MCVPAQVYGTSGRNGRKTGKKGQKSLAEQILIFQQFLLIPIFKTFIIKPTFYSERKDNPT